MKMFSMQTFPYNVPCAPVHGPWLACFATYLLGGPSEDIFLCWSLLNFFAYLCDSENIFICLVFICFTLKLCSSCHVVKFTACNGDSPV